MLKRLKRLRNKLRAAARAFRWDGESLSGYDEIAGELIAVTADAQILARIAGGAKPYRAELLSRRILNKMWGVAIAIERREHALNTYANALMERGCQAVIHDCADLERKVNELTDRLHDYLAEGQVSTVTSADVEQLLEMIRRQIEIFREDRMPPYADTITVRLRISAN
jgi:hypothetical protein